MKSSPNKQASAHIELILELYTLIPSSYKITLGELHQKLLQRGIHRSTRTIQRSLDIITHYFDVEKDERSKPYGYRKILTGSARLKSRETALLLLSMRCLNPILPKEISSSFTQSYNDAEHYYSKHHHKHKELLWLSRIHLVDNHISTKQLSMSKSFNTINEALYHQKQVKLTTRDARYMATPVGVIIDDECSGVLIKESEPDSPVRFIRFDTIESAQRSTFHAEQNSFSAFAQWLANNGYNPPSSLDHFPSR
ncbi:hypothetical protein [Vibrio sp. TBV020]|uniref:hypothetical protein n=1 Tax=Vibrio sp. TBV020 TaxID=3137398 RepID=UPI0038CDBA19